MYNYRFIKTLAPTSSYKLNALASVKEKLESMPENEEGVILRQKFLSIFEHKNEGLELLKKIYPGDIPENMTPEVYRCLHYAPLTSVVVERSFSQFKLILTDRRHSFIDVNLEETLL